ESVASVSVYARCTCSAQCGPSECAVCGHYAGVQNPNAFQVCYSFCSADTECAPANTTSDVTPRCVLGQCVLLCHSGSTCPQNAACLPWVDSSTSNMFAGFDGLCE